MARAKQDSLRYSSFETERLTLALLISLLLHLAVWGGYEGGKKLGWWEKLRQLTQTHQAAKKNPPAPAVQQTEEPEIFVDVSHAEPEPPKQTKYYSNKNSIAANPNAHRDEKQPELNGKQKMVPKTEDTPRLVKLQPTPPPQPAQPQEKPAPETPPAKPAPPNDPMSLGDLQLAKTTDANAANPQQAQPPQRERPRTLKAAQAQQPQLPGQQMQQAGGVRRQRLWSSLDARATPFGDYDRAIVEAVTDHWYALLDSRHFAQDRTGKVILKFKLKYDGTITEMQPLESTVGETLNYVCQEAIEEAAPFAAWPPDMRRMIADNYREISFVFYYY
jgi:outer membrane biosynthesis protein TonB